MRETTVSRRTFLKGSAATAALACAAGSISLGSWQAERAAAAEPAVTATDMYKRQLVVTIDVQMSETALASDYVLPECTYLERMELPEFIGGKKHYVAMRTRCV